MRNISTILLTIILLPAIVFAQAPQVSVKTPFLTFSENYSCEIGVDFTKLLEVNGRDAVEVAFEDAEKKSIKREKKAKKRSKKLFKKAKSATGKNKKSLRKKAKKARKRIKPEKNFREELAKCQNGALPPAFPVEIKQGSGNDEGIPTKYIFISGTIFFIQDKLTKLDISIMSSSAEGAPGYFILTGSKNLNQPDQNIPSYNASGSFKETLEGTVEDFRASFVLGIEEFLFYIRLNGTHLSQPSIFSLDSVLILFNPDNDSDLDADGDIDLKDYNEFTRCYSGPNILALPDCTAADSDSDGDVDFQDYQVFFSSGFKFGGTNNWNWN